LPTAIIYSSAYLEHRPPYHHPESPQRLEEALRGLRGSGLLDRGGCTVVEPRAASPEDLCLVHDQAYVERVERLVRSGSPYLDGDTYLSPGSFNAATLALGGALKACDLVLDGAYSNAYALVRPPGHHAGAFGAALGVPSQGFCIFNNVAAAAAHLVKRRGLRRVLILDIDCHHGNGTQEIFYESSQVLYVSFHQDPRTLYPGTGFIDEVGVGEGAGFNVNIPLPPRSGEDAYLKAWGEVVEPIALEFKPEFVLASAGYDAHRDDPLTMMNLTTRSYAELFRRMLSLASRCCAGRFVAVLEGGYGSALREGVAASVAAMMGSSIPLTEESSRSSVEVLRRLEDTLAKLKALLKEWWKLS
jgi:acetoin utilization deacetylase AcuC-like enzyme